MDNDINTLKQELAALKAENEALKNPPKKERTLSFKVSTKGAVSVYGLQKFPVTLYAKQWTKLFATVEALQAFMIEHAPIIKQDKDDVAKAIPGSSEAA